MLANLLSGRACRGVPVLGILRCLPSGGGVVDMRYFWGPKSGVSAWVLDPS